MFLKKSILFVSLLTLSYSANTPEYYLSNSASGVTKIFKDVSMPLDISKVICDVESGTKVEKISEKPLLGTTMTEVKVLEGDCQGNIGWVGKENLKIIVR
ncbi:hypothetical protein N5U00_08180 [Aliarcobacter butzleri]|uniref:hypothetical protein n=1 Tax=Aliarcobacter butzleri TaxID=28197 RepID=UPI001EDBE044|nr:hypothetical protein [Aliarcobacter butzleri]MCG3705796.1 hypothetical protein [Aliarcobacter butzleri]MCT7575305.1 hypothetical protein [Aliarcobacter butzleri]